MNRLVIVFALLVLSWSAPAAAQAEQDRFQAGVQLAGAVSGEFEKTDIGVGGRMSWHPTPLVGAEAEVDFYPADFPHEPAFSASRVEGLFGVTVGPRIGEIRPFARVRPGFVAFSEAPEPIACIAIFPPPLSCAMASGKTVFALDLGGGIEWLSTGRVFVRVDAGDRLLRYPGPAIDRRGAARDESFFGHDFRFAGGAGVRF